MLHKKTMDFVVSLYNGKQLQFFSMQLVFPEIITIQIRYARSPYIVPEPVVSVKKEVPRMMRAVPFLKHNFPVRVMIFVVEISCLLIIYSDPQTMNTQPVFAGARLWHQVSCCHSLWQPDKIMCS